jgi:hypothetical protein
MSQKSSLLQSARSVPKALTPDTWATKTSRAVCAALGVSALAILKDMLTSFQNCRGLLRPLGASTHVQFSATIDMFGFDFRHGQRISARACDDFLRELSRRRRGGRKEITGAWLSIDRKLSLLRERQSYKI